MQCAPCFMAAAHFWNMPQVCLENFDKSHGHAVLMCKMQFDACVVFAPLQCKKVDSLSLPLSLSLQTVK